MTKNTVYRNGIIVKEVHSVDAPLRSRVGTVVFQSLLAILEDTGGRIK